MSFLEHIKNWQFDPSTAVITIVLMPIGIYLLAVAKKYIKLWSIHVIDGLMYYVSRAVNAKLSSRLTLKRFARLRLGDENRYLHVPSSLDVKLEIDQTFVPLTLESQSATGKAYGHSELISIGNRLRVIGDPGSGKSSLVKRLLRDACYMAIESPASAKLPILVELKNLAIPETVAEDNLGLWLKDQLRITTSALNVYRIQECFDIYLSGPGLLVLLDGLDEVSSVDYSRVKKAIEGLARILSEQSEKNVVVLTMRTQFHQQVRDDYRQAFGQALFLKPFTPTDIYKFLCRWPFNERKEENISRIYKELTDRPSLREMCSNPLVLAMYVADDQHHSATISPDSRTEFYSKVTTELLIKRRLRQTGAAPAHTKLKEQRERVLGRLALDNMLDAGQPTNLLRWEDAIRVVMEIHSVDRSQAELLFKDLSKETGLVTEERESETLRFIHLTFCEFLAAHEAVHSKRDGWKELIEHHKLLRASANVSERSRLLEVIPFACGLMPRSERAAALDLLCLLPDNDLLERCFLETKLYEHHSWKLLVGNESANLCNTPPAEWGTDWLRRLHMFNVVVRDAKVCANHAGDIDLGIDIERFFILLVNDNRAGMSEVLGAYAAQDAAAALRIAEVCNLDMLTQFPEIILENLSQAPFFALILDLASREKARASSWAALLSEAALRSRPIRAKLVESSAPQSWQSLVREVPNCLRWNDGKLAENNFFTQCVTLALMDPGKLHRSLSLTKLIAELPAPGSYRVMRYARSILFLWGVFCVTTTLVVGGQIGVDFSATKNNWTTLPIFIFLMPLYVFILYSSTLKLAYRLVLGVVTYRPPQKHADLPASVGTRDANKGSVSKSSFLRRLATLLPAALDPFFLIMPAKIRRVVVGMREARVNFLELRIGTYKKSEDVLVNTGL